MIAAVEAASVRPVSRETFEKLGRYVDLLIAENGRQNLIARSTESDVWKRHIADSAQLLRFAPPEGGRWLDIGTGAGLPGLVIAILTGDPVTLVEPRRLRAEFLERAAAELDLRVTVTCAKVEKLTGQFDVITARAVAAADALFGMAAHLSHPGTIWILPKGRSAKSELDAALQAWQGSFRLEPSVTSGEAAILVASHVRRKGQG